MPQSYLFQELFAEQLNDLYSAEEQLMTVLPRIIAVTSSGSLRESFEHYLHEVSHHVETLGSIFQDLSLHPTGAICRAIEGLLENSEEIMHHGGNSAVKDAALIATIQKIQHYKIAAYGVTRTFARHMNYGKTMDLLQRDLNEEAESDRKLTRLAEGGIFTTGINEEAARAALQQV